MQHGGAHHFLNDHFPIRAPRKSVENFNFYEISKMEICKKDFSVFFFDFFEKK